MTASGNVRMLDGIEHAITRVLQFEKRANSLSSVTAMFARFYYGSFFVMLCEMLLKNLLNTSCLGYT